MQQDDSQSQPITMIVPLGAGSSVDLATQIIAAEYARRFGRQIGIELHPGQGGTTGTAHAAQAVPDGNTLVVVSNGTMAINLGLYRDPGYVPLRDFAPLVLVGEVANVMIVHPDEAANSASEFIEAARRAGDALSYSSGGVGTTHHLSGVMFGANTGLAVEHVAFDTSVEAIRTIVEGRVRMGFFNLPTVISLIRDGYLKPLAVTGKARCALLPEVPTFEAIGFPKIEMAAWFGVAAPAKTPAPILNTLHAQISEVLEAADVRHSLVELGFELAQPGPRKAFAKLIEAEIPRWAAIVEQSGAQPL